MGQPQRIYRTAVLTTSAIFIALGVAILASTFINGGGPLSLGTLLGLAFVAVGAGRVWLAVR